MSLHLRSGTIAVLGLAALFLAPAPAHAVILNLELTVDEPTRGVAVLSGNIDEAFKFFGEQPGPAPSLGFGVIGQWWSVNTKITKFGDGPKSFNLRVSGMHEQRPPGAEHVGEATKGLLLGETLQTNLRGENLGGIGPQDAVAQLIHPGAKSHVDRLVSHVDDLNADAPGYLTPDNQLSVRIELTHGEIPEPSSLVLSAVGFLGLIGRPRRRGIARPVD